jgi:hypothetical protein
MSLDINCGICFDSLIDYKNIIIFSEWGGNNKCRCRARYHISCLIEWETHKKYKQCPYCRLIILKDTIEPKNIYTIICNKILMIIFIYTYLQYLYFYCI